MVAEALIRELFLKESRIASLVWRLPHDLRRLLFMGVFNKKYRFYSSLLQGYAGNAFHDHSSIFVHVPKAAGISVGHSFFYGKGANHLSISHYQLLFSAQQFNAYFKFAFVRNPWDRMVSAYTFLMAGGYVQDDKNFAEQVLSKYENFAHFVKEWIRPENLNTRIHFLPQYYFVCGPNGKIEMDFIGKFENLESDFAFVAQKIGVHTTLQHQNMTHNRRKDYRAYYDDESAEIIASTYQRDIALFDYAFDDRPLSISN